MLLWALSHFRDRDGYAYPSQRELMREAGIRDWRDFKKARDKIVELLGMEFNPKGKKVGQHWVTVYRIPHTPDCVDAPVSSQADESDDAPGQEQVHQKSDAPGSEVDAPGFGVGHAPGSAPAGTPHVTPHSVELPSARVCAREEDGKEKDDEVRFNELFDLIRQCSLDNTTPTKETKRLLRVYADDRTRRIFIGHLSHAVATGKTFAIAWAAKCTENELNKSPGPTGKIEFYEPKPEPPADERRANLQRLAELSRGLAVKTIPQETASA